MTDFGRDSWLSEIAERTRRTGDPALLTAHLRQGGAIDGQLSNLIADILDGTLSVRRRKRHLIFAVPPSYLKGLVAYCSRALQGKVDLGNERWDALVTMAREAGVEGPLPCDRKAAGDAARMIVARRYAATDAQLSEASSPRTSRRKAR